MKNNSNVPISFKISLDSANETQRKECELKRFMNSNDLRFKPPIGPSNHSGQSSFDIYPTQGTILAGGKQDLKCLFSPDHASELFADVMRISLVSTDKNNRVIQLNGKCRKNNIYFRGVESLTQNMNNESIILTDIDVNTTADSAEGTGKDAADKAAKLGNELSENATNNIPIPILVTLYSISSSKVIGEYSQAEKTIHIGCMKSNAVSKEGKKVFERILNLKKNYNLFNFFLILRVEIFRLKI